MRCPIVIALKLFRKAGNIQVFAVFKDKREHLCLEPLVSGNEVGSLKRLVVTLIKNSNHSGVSEETKEKLAGLINSLRNIKNKNPWTFENDILNIKIAKEEEKELINDINNIKASPENKSIAPAHNIFQNIKSANIQAPGPQNIKPPNIQAPGPQNINPSGAPPFKVPGDVGGVLPKIPQNPANPANFNNPPLQVGSQIPAKFDAPNPPQPKNFHCPKCKKEPFDMVQLSCKCILSHECLAESIMIIKCRNCDQPISPEKLEEVSLYFG